MRWLKIQPVPLFFIFVSHFNSSWFVFNFSVNYVNRSSSSSCDGAIWMWPLLSAMKVRDDPESEYLRILIVCKKVKINNRNSIPTFIGMCSWLRGLFSQFLRSTRPPFLENMTNLLYIANNKKMSPIKIKYSNNYRLSSTRTSISSGISSALSKSSHILLQLRICTPRRASLEQL